MLTINLPLLIWLSETVAIYWAASSQNGQFALIAGHMTSVWLCLLAQNITHAANSASVQPGLLLDFWIKYCFIDYKLQVGENH